MNRKGFVQMYAALIFILFFGFMFLFISSYMFEAGGSYGITPLVNFSSQQANNLNLSTELKDVITQTETDYYNTSLPYDLLFFSGVTILFITNLIGSFKARKEGFLSIFGIITIGNAVFFTILSILTDVKEWLFDNMFYSVFGTGYLATPLIDAIYNNFGIFALCWVGIMVLVNQFDADLLNRNQGRFEE